MTKEVKPEKVHEFNLKQIDEICSSTWESIYRYIYFKVQNQQEAEDITQETYVKAITHFNKSDIQIEKTLAFLKAVALNVLRDRWRKGKRQGTSVNLDAIDPEKTAIQDSIEAITQRATIENALLQLSIEQRTIIELRIIKGYSVAETAKIIGKKDGTIRVMQYRALQALAKILKNIE